MHIVVDITIVSIHLLISLSVTLVQINLLINIYSKLKEEWDLQYQKPTERIFVAREFNKKTFSNSRSRNFFTIIKVLAENGYCTINEIIDKDGMVQTPGHRKKRHGIYARLIKGKLAKLDEFGELDKHGNFDGLIDKMLVEVEDKKNWKTRRNNHYRLTLFGMLYAIHLFSEDLNYSVGLDYNNQIKYEIKSTTKYKKNILDVLVENYSDKLPLIFKRWDFMVSEFGTLVNFLVGFAHFTKKFGDMLHKETILSTEPVYMKDWTVTDRSISSELSILLFAWIARQDYYHKAKFTKDKKILDLYKKYIEFLKKRQYYESLKVQYEEAILYEKYDKAKKIIIELLEGKKFKKGMKLDRTTEIRLEFFDKNRKNN